MSNTELAPVEQTCGQSEDGGRGPVVQRLPGREVQLTTRQTPTGDGASPLGVDRFLPTRDRRMVGAWCFLDRYGPTPISGEGMQVPPHPHTGLQTVSWLLSGEVMHRDSLGSEQLIRPGQLNLMTAGRGIAHSERSPGVAPEVLHGLQLWVALPDGSRAVAPDFAHHATLPVLEVAGAHATVLMGALGGAQSPATAYTPIVGADVQLGAGTPATLPLREDFEHAVLVIEGQALLDGDEPLTTQELVYLGTGRGALHLEAAAGCRLLLLGGEPFDEQLVMWWNFVGRSHDDIVADREDWQGEDGSGRFGVVASDPGARLPAPALPATPLRSRGRVR